MRVKSIKLINFKKFRDDLIDFNDDVNIFVGDNNSGKSTILEALEIVLNFNHRGRSFNGEFAPDIFNQDAVNQFLSSDKTSKHLPNLIIEAYIEGVPEYRGSNNTLEADAQGLIVCACFDKSLESVYEDYLKTDPSISSIPIEFYKLEWLDFGWNPIKPIAKKFKALYIDPSRLHPTVGKNQYISSILNTTLDREELAKLTLNYRENQQMFNESGEVRAVNDNLDADHLITEKKLSIAANTLPSGSIQTGLQLEIDDVPFRFIGKGEQRNCVLNKLSIDKICLLHSGYKRLHNLNPTVVKTLKRLPGYDTLRVALSEKVILVEGPSDELVLKKIYLRTHGCLPEQHGIDIIVVRGVGFKTFIEVGKEIGTKIHILRDNDGDYLTNILEEQERFSDFPNVKIFSPVSDEEFSIEPALIYANAIDIKTLDAFSKEVLSTKTYKFYDTQDTLEDRINYLIQWFMSVKGNGKGARKVDSAIRLFDSNFDFRYPAFLDEVFDFG